MLDDFKCFKTKYFKLSKSGSRFESVHLDLCDYPITIRNYKEGDSIKMRYGTKKINRFFIDNKISHLDRKKWPVMLNSNGDIILVPGIGCDKYHYCPNNVVYMIKL